MIYNPFGNELYIFATGKKPEGDGGPFAHLKLKCDDHHIEEYFPKDGEYKIACRKCHTNGNQRLLEVTVRDGKVTSAKSKSKNNDHILSWLDQME